MFGRAIDAGALFLLATETEEAGSAGHDRKMFSLMFVFIFIFYFYFFGRLWWSSLNCTEAIRRIGTSPAAIMQLEEACHMGQNRIVANQFF